MNINHDLHVALTKLRESTRGPGMAPNLGEAFELLDAFGTFADLDTWHQTNGWPTRPTVHRELGVQIRRRKIVDGTRISGNHSMFIVAETREWVVFEVFTSKGEHVGEHAIEKADFADEFERKE